MRGSRTKLPKRARMLRGGRWVKSVGTIGVLMALGFFGLIRGPIFHRRRWSSSRRHPRLPSLGQAGRSLKRTTTLRPFLQSALRHAELGRRLFSRPSALCPPGQQALGKILFFRTCSAHRHVLLLYTSYVLFQDWHLQPLLSVESVPGRLLVHPSPLLEEEGDVVVQALSLEGLHPIFLHQSCSRPTFPADDHPINVIAVRRHIYVAQEWFGGDERDVFRKSDVGQVFSSLVKSSLILG